MARDFAKSDFVVLFTGEGAWSTLKHGWEEARDFALSEFIGEGEHDWSDDVNEQMNDEDSWTHAESGDGVNDRLVFGPIQIGEISSLKIIRIID